MLSAVFPPAKEVLKKREGALAETSFPLILCSIDAENRTCTLELKRNQLKKRIGFEDGFPVACDSNLRHETLGAYLVEKGKLTEEQHLKALADAAAAETPLNEFLVKSGLILPIDLYKAMQASLALKILDCFTWRDAQYRILGEPLENETPLKMYTPQLILTGVSNFSPFEMVAQQMVFFDGQRFARPWKPPQGVELDKLKLGPKEQKFMEMLKARPTFGELQAGAQMASEEALRKIYAFAMLGLCAFAEQVPEKNPDGDMIPISPTPAGPARGEIGIVSPVSALATPDELMQFFLKHRQQDPFDLLAVAETAKPDEVKRAYLKYAEKWAPWRFTAGEESLHEKAEEVFNAGAKAFALLADYEQKNLAVERRRRKAEEAKRTKERKAGESFKITTDLLDADTQFAEGKQRLAAGQWHAAAEFFQYAADMEPRKGVLRAYLNWAKYKDSPALAARFLADLAAAQRLDPKCAELFWFEGEIRESEKDLAGAEDAYRKAFKLNPGDRRSADKIKDISRLRAQKR
jgi:hypothetical protein